MAIRRLEQRRHPGQLYGERRDTGVSFSFLSFFFFSFFKENFHSTSSECWNERRNIERNIFCRFFFFREEKNSRNEEFEYLSRNIRSVPLLFFFFLSFLFLFSRGITRFKFLNLWFYFTVKLDEIPYLLSIPFHRVVNNRCILSNARFFTKWKYDDKKILVRYLHLFLRNIFL